MNSVEQSQQFYANQAASNPANQFDYVPTNPDDVELVETYEESLVREAAEREQVLYEAELAATRGRLEVENANLAREQLINIETAEAPLQTGLVSDVVAEASRFVGQLDNGMKITLILDDSGKIITSYPFLD